MEENTDSIQEGFSKILEAINGFPGDVVVLSLLGLMVLCLIKRKYKPAVGFLVLTVGVVIVRILIYNIF